MIDSQHHVSIGGVKYRLYESGGEGHYQSAYEPVRPPNSMVVQGTGRQDLFQTRPDVLLWSVTDWSGGEGQIKYDPQNPNRQGVLHRVDPFSRPGQVHPGPLLRTTNNNAGSSWSEEHCQLVIMGRTSELWAVDVSSATKNYYVWNNSTDRWSAASTIPTATGPTCLDGIDTDDEYLYYYDKTNGDLYKFDGQTSIKMNSIRLGATPPSSTSPIGHNYEASDIANGFGSTGYSQHEGVVVRELGDYVMLIQPGVGKAWEIVKTANGDTEFSELDNWAPAAGGGTKDFLNRVTKGPDRLYVLLDYDGGDTTVRELVPSTAAGAGFGKEIAVWKGIVGNALWWHNGMLFIAAHEIGQAVSKYRRIILYLQPGGTYGTLGYVRDPDEDQDARVVTGTSYGSSLTDSHFVSWGADLQLWTVDSLSGGLACLSTASTNGTAFSGVVRWEGSSFVSTLGGATPRIWWTTPLPRWPQYVNYQSEFITPWHDMGLAEEKVLSSITIHCNKLGANWQIDVYYRRDGETGDTYVDSYTTDGGTGEKYVISTDTTPILYRKMRVRVNMYYVGGGEPLGNTMPIINSVEIRSQLANRTKVWSLRVDLTDDLSGVTQSHAGNKKIDNIQALQAGSVVEFLDGYTHRNPAEYDTYDVVVDSTRVVLDRAGEGYAEIVLREVA